MENDILSAPFDMSFHLTHKCNLRCTHCYIRAGDSSGSDPNPEQMSEVLDKLIKIKIFKAQLTGGEPMLRSDFFDIIKKLHKKMWVSLSTNGTLINEDNIEELTDYVKEFIISIDGATARSHDKFRGANGSFDKTVRAIQFLNDNAKKEVITNINSTLSKNNIGEAEDLIDLAISLKVKALRFSILYPKGRALDNKHLFLSKEEIKEVISRILKKKKNLENIEIDFDETFRVPLKLFGFKSQIGRNGDGRNKNKGCGVAHTKFSIMPNGEIIPCELFQENPEYIIGNALKDNISRLWLESKILNSLRNGTQGPELCKSCKHEKECETILCAAIIRTNSYWCIWYES